MTARTLNRPVEFNGVGLHSGQPSRVVVHPARRGWTIGRPGATAVPIQTCRRRKTRWQTVIELPDGSTIATVEHLLAAVSGLSLACRIEVQGAEMPVLDGSSRCFVDAFLDAGFRAADSPLECLELLDCARVSGPDGAWIHAEPADTRCLIVTAELAGRQIGPVEWGGAVDQLVGDFAPARTFALEAWVHAQQAQGLARGGSLDNALVFNDRGEPLNPSGLRLPDEPARHKLLDLLGDLALLGAPLRARVCAFRPGHTLNAALVKAIRPICRTIDAGVRGQAG